MPILPVFLSLLKTHWKPLLVFTAVFLWSIGWYNYGVRTERSRWQAKEIAASLEAIKVERENIKTSFSIGSGYETIKGNIDTSFNGYLNSLSDTSDIARETNTTIKSNEASRCYGLPQANKRKLLGLAREAEINTQQLISLQRWVNEVK